MASVTNLTIKPQTGSDSVHYASWDFNTTATNTTAPSGVVKVGSLVTINAGATYYNGSRIPDWVKEDKWYIKHLKGDRAVLGKNQSKTNDITSPINIANITVVGSSSSSTSTTVSIDTLDHFEVKWYYDSGDGVWFSGGESNTTEKNATYSAPANTVKIKVYVKPVSKTHTVNDKETSYWTGTSVSAEYSVAVDPPDAPSAPSVTISNFTLTAALENISDPRADKIQFQIYNGTELFTTGTVDVVTCQARFTCNVAAGGKYRVRCRSVNIYSSSEVYSAWSNYCNEVTTMPTATSIFTCKAKSETSVLLEWNPVSNATAYELEYTTKLEYFEGSDQISSESGIEYTRYEKTGLESGSEYFFRVRATNGQGNSSWSNIVSVIIGKKPAAPTTWSSTTTAIVGEPLTLYWAHNAEDGSDQTYAEIEIYVDEVKETHTIRSTATEEGEEEATMFFTFDTSPYSEGTVVLWRVRTAGVTNEYGDWSIQRTVDVYAPPTLVLGVTDINGEILETLYSFPFYVSGKAGPETQTPISYHLTVTSNEVYTMVNNMGNTQVVNQGEAVYSKIFDTSDDLLVELSAGNINLENGVRYTVVCTVSMNSGLTAEASSEFTVAWVDGRHEPDAMISVDTDTMTAYIRPFCKDSDGNFIEDVTLSVYRREFDGTFTELATGISNSTNTFVTDPHPSLDYARYRIVAITSSTGAVSFYDAPGYPIGEKAAIIQWSEIWTSFDATSEDALEQPPWSGSLLKLPYNIDVSDKRSIDISLVKYIGRKHPVSYYGTQLGETASWSMEIPKNDKDTLYALRRLSVWTGDVYVREPSGSGYWASISVSFSQKHRELTIPVTLDITRVTGGA